MYFNFSSSLRSIWVASVFVCFISICVACGDNHINHIDGKLLKQSTASEVNWVGHWRDEGDKGILVREVANEYEFLHQDVHVNLKFPEDLYGAGGPAEIDFIVSQLKKPNPDWDIIRLYGYFPEIGKILNEPDWTDKYLVDFSQVPGFIDSHYDFIRNKIYKKRFHNKFFGPYNEVQLAALFVNTEMAKKMGLAVKQFDMTFDDFVGYIKVADEYRKSHSDFVPFFEYDWGKTTTMFRILFFSLMDNFDEITDPVLTQKKLDAIEKCYMACEQLSAYHPIEPNWQKHLWASENETILQDHCLFFPNLTLMYNIWKKNDPKQLTKVIPCEFPVFKVSSTYIGGYNANWAVLKNSPHRDEAIKLLMYWCRPDVAEKWVRYSKSSSGVKGNLTASSFGLDPYESYSYLMEKKYGGNLLKDEDVEYIVGEKNKNIPLHIQDVLEGQMSGREAFMEFKRKAIF